MTTANIFDIQRNSFVDGPGIRTTVFFKGCNLKCKWCHNPESQSSKPQIMFYKDKCTGCGRCSGLTVKNTEFVCFNDAKQICGKEYTVEEIFNIIQKDKLFYETSNGGIHFQLNYTSSEELLKAKAYPEKYRNLKVRVTGYSDYFTNLNEAIQDSVIKRYK